MSKLIPAYQKRVVLEKAELRGKINSLSSFLDRAPPGVSTTELRRMDVQLNIMKAYDSILTARIVEFSS